VFPLRYRIEYTRVTTHDGEPRDPSSFSNGTRNVLSAPLHKRKKLRQVVHEGELRPAGDQYPLIAFSAAC
jgi:hypothetical protein